MVGSDVISYWNSSFFSGTFVSLGNVPFLQRSFSPGCKILEKPCGSSKRKTRGFRFVRFVFRCRKEKLDLKRDIRETQLENEGQVKMLVQVGGDSTASWTPRPTIYKWMEMVISNHFLYKDLVHHPIETTIYKRLALGFQAAVRTVQGGGEKTSSLKIRSWASWP